MRDTIGNQVFAVFGGGLAVVGELEDGVVEAGIDLIAEWIAGEKIVAAAHVERQPMGIVHSQTK